MHYSKILEKNEKGYVLRVRLQPNSSSCQIKEILSTESGDFIKISVRSIPEKGKANKELIEFLAKKLKIAKSDIEIISGELDKYKKILLKTDNIEKIEQLLENSEE